MSQNSSVLFQVCDTNDSGEAVQAPGVRGSIASLPDTCNSLTQVESCSKIQQVDSCDGKYEVDTNEADPQKKNKACGKVAKWDPSLSAAQKWKGRCEVDRSLEQVCAVSDPATKDQQFQGQSLFSYCEAQGHSKESCNQDSVGLGRCVWSTCFNGQCNLPNQQLICKTAGKASVITP